MAQWIPFARSLAVLAALAVSPAPALAQDPIRIGFMATLSGPPGAIGEHMRDGFELALDMAGDSAGGRPIEVVVVDDELKPDLAVTRVRELIDRDGIDFLAGVTFSNIQMAIFRPVTEAEVFYIGANAGASDVAGRRCSPFFFSASYQNDQVHEVMGAHASASGAERVFLVAPNYQAGRDAIAGFERRFDGEVVDIVYTPLNSLDFSAEMARIASAAPDAVFAFMPGGMGVGFVKQFRQAGLADTTRFLSAFTVDEVTMRATQDAALGLYGASHWAPNLEGGSNARFVEAFREKYGYPPSMFAAQGYDAANLILSAIETVGGDLSDKDAVRAALAAADFESVRGDFSFNTNQFPVQDFYLTRSIKTPDGDYVMEAAEKVFDDYADAYAADCRM